MRFEQEIKKLIDSNLKTYRDNSDRFIADYNRELELTKEYNGRQLLELLQNADDAASPEVLIKWDKDNLKLTISNKGEPFETGGIKSLMLANLSTKTKISYIGNKGLGFRSILNWAEQINIVSNGCLISFSETIAKNIFENELNLTPHDKKQLRLDRNLTLETVPFPILGIPIIQTNVEQSDWITSIEITYRKEFENDIANQLSEITEEILLFLNKVKKITILQNGDSAIELISNKEETESFEIVSIQDKIWHVFSMADELPLEYQDKTKNEKQSYSLKVAFQDNLSDKYHKLFNFFPTQLSISLPCIIHGTFELNSSRNHLNESKKNEFILKQLVELLTKCALHLTTEQIDWRAYKLLTPSLEQSDSKLIIGFYKKLKERKFVSSIFPCISNKYLPFKESVYYSDDFNSFFQQHFSGILTQLLLPLNNEITNIFNDVKYKHEYLIETIDNLSNNITDINIRAELITQLSKIIPFKDEQERFSLLVNEFDKVISKEDLAFTPVVRSEEKFNIPKSVKVDFMKSELYDLLIAKFENTFDKKEPRSRELQRCIKSVVNLQPYDSNNVIEKIITGTKDALKYLENKDESIDCVKDMVSALFANFKNIENRQDRVKISLLLISKSNEICNSEDLFLSQTYPSGALTEIIYEGLLTPVDYLADIDSWGLIEEEADTVESFFLWLGVNKHSKIIKIYLQNNWSESKYIDFIFKNGTDKPDNFEIGRIQKDSNVFKIDRFDEIQNLPVNKVILLALKDSFIRKQLEGNEERISWFYVAWRPAIAASVSYLRYQFLKSNLFTKYILEDGSEELNMLINNDFQIDFEFLSQFGINKTEVKAILLKLGAKESFNEIAPESIYEIIKSIPEKDKSKEGKNTQKIYKLALESLVKQYSKIKVPDDLVFFSKKCELEEYQPANQIYYSNNAILPKKILDTLYLLNLPKRAGEDNVEQYFGVKSLHEFKIQIDPDSVKENQFNNEFNKYFESIKPYLLAYRLESPNLKKKVTDLKTKQNEANAIKQCRVNLVNECKFNFEDKQHVPIEQKEYINIKNIFYYKDNTIISIDSLKRDSVFCDAFAEMICITFKVNDLKNDFRQILKNELSDTIHLSGQDLSSEKIEEAFQLLGISRIEIDFWRRIFSHKGKQLIEPIENLEVLKSRVLSNLDFELTDKYSEVDFESFSNNESFELISKISSELLLSVQQIVPQGISQYHKNKFVDSIKDNEHIFKQLLWLKLSNIEELQFDFISTLTKFNQNFISTIVSEIESLKYILIVDYTAEICKWVNKYFDVDLNNNVIEEILFENKYKDLLFENGIEESDIADEQIRSLLYFENNTEKIEAIIKKNCIKEQADDYNSQELDENQTGTIIDASLVNSAKPASVKNGTPTNGTWVHSNQSDKTKKRRGKAAELLVYNTLKKKYGKDNVKWVSGSSTTPDKNDNLHYDIEYKNKNNEWKYLEVKSISDDNFIISNAEKDKGLAEPDKYEMALVRDTNIFFVKDIFKFNVGESFENNSKFTAQAKDYVFSFNINNLTKD